MDNYLKLIKLQSDCSYLTLNDSIHLTELIKTGNCIDIAVFLLEIIEDMDTTITIKLKDIVKQNNL